MSVAIVTIGVFLLTASGHGELGGTRFLARMFEAVSAFCTVGLSMGITNEVSVADEHVATAISQLAMSHLYSLAAPSDLRREHILIACVDGLKKLY